MLDEIKNKKMIKYLIGGFIYAITHGIKEIIKEEYETQLRAMDFGSLKMMFYYGEKCFGVLFCRETNNILHQKLKNFVLAFETTFPDRLEGPAQPTWLSESGEEAGDPVFLEKVKVLLKEHFKFWGNIEALELISSKAVNFDF